MSRCLFLTVIYIFASSICEGCEDGDVRLVGGGSIYEGRVEVCYEDAWGTVCDDMWDGNDATVVCRQLGFSTQNSQFFDLAHFGEGSQQQAILLDNVQCFGSETRLFNCHARPINVHNCEHFEDAGVQCEPRSKPPPPEVIYFTITDSLLFIEWEATSTELSLIIYLVIIHNQSNNETTTFNVPATYTEFQYELYPDQDYSCCLSAVFDQAISTAVCKSFRTPATTEGGMGNIQSTMDNSCSLLGGVLGSVTVVLVLLLLVAVMILVYPRCRSKVKDKRYLSSVSQILDRAIYIDQNPAYIQQPQASTSSNTAAEQNQNDSVPSYEVVRDPRPNARAPRSRVTAPAGHVRGPASHVTAPGGHVTADLIAEHYEVQDMSQVRLGPESTTVQDYEVPLEMKTGAKTMNRDDYSHLHHK